MRIMLICISLLVTVFSVKADTINNYVNISNDIPKMEVKADAEAQAWARSARHVLTIADETIFETLMQANAIAKQQGKPLFCPPANISFSSELLKEIILETYQSISSQQSDKDKMTVSQVALMGVIKKYPCGKSEDTSMNGFINQLQNN